MKIVHTSLFVAVSIVVAACNGGPGTSPATQGPVPTQITYSGAAAQIPVSQGTYSGTVTLPTSSAPPSPVTITLLTSFRPFSAAPTLPAKNRRNTPLAAPLITTDTPILYFQLTASASVVLSSQPAFQFVVPASVNPVNGPFYVAFFDPTVSPFVWNMTLEGPGTVNGSTLTFTPTASPFSMQANVSYYYILYQAVNTQASPSPSPSPSPAPTPPGVLGLSPSSLSLYGVGAGNAKQSVLQETGYTGTFGEMDTCAPSIATIASSSSTGPTSTITVTGVASGTCTATYSDSFGQTAILTVNVTVSGFTISTRVR